MDAITTYVKTTEESIALTARKAPCIIISASGMASGGRVLHHLKALLPNPRHCVLFLGFQAQGTRGYSLVHGSKTIKIHGEEHPVAAQIINLDALSSHGDYRELITWLQGMKSLPKKIFLTHGEEQAALALQAHLAQAFPEVATEIPSYLAKVEL